jgi:hypothetical protein
MFNFFYNKYSTILINRYIIIYATIALSLLRFSIAEIPQRNVSKSNDNSVPDSLNVGEDFFKPSETAIKASNKPDKEGKASSSVEDILNNVSWIGLLKSKMNIWQGAGWNLPVHLGDSRDHIYHVLGDPSDESDQ